MKQETALKVLRGGHNVYLTGPAGSGKTFLLNQYIEELREENVSVAVTASTGIAATHMGGRTIHAWSGIGIKDALPKKEIKKILRKQDVLRRLKKVKVLIIDEASMLHAYQLDLVNKVMREARGSWEPFGGVQVILSGDLFQLPPVKKDNVTEIKFVNNSSSWREMDIKVCYLSEQFRQEEGSLTNVLNDIRTRSVDENTAEMLQECRGRTLESVERPTKLFTHNSDVDAINTMELSKIANDPLAYQMGTRGEEKLVQSLKEGCLSPEKLILKKDALVMFVKNNFERGYVNGTIGTVIGFDDDSFPIVETLSGDEIYVRPATWTVEESGSVLAEITQLPLRLAWAITVHKSQGMTLDAVEADLSKSFEYGMGYVALSRVAALENLNLLGLNRMALEINPAVFDIDEKFKEQSLTVEEMILEEETMKKSLKKKKKRNEKKK